MKIKILVRLMILAVIAGLITAKLNADDSLPNIRPYDFNKYGYCVTGKYNEDRGGYLHAGIDYGLVYGTSVNATADGVVKVSAMRGRYGLLIVIDHKNGYESYYAHLSEPLVLRGTQVKKGQIIALSGNSGNVKSHLHYGVHQDRVGFIFPYVKER